MVSRSWGRFSTTLTMEQTAVRQTLHPYRRVDSVDAKNPAREITNASVPCLVAVCTVPLIERQSVDRRSENLQVDDPLLKRLRRYRCSGLRRSLRGFPWWSSTNPHCARCLNRCRVPVQCFRMNHSGSFGHPRRRWRIVSAILLAAALSLTVACGRNQKDVDPAGIAFAYTDQHRTKTSHAVR